MEYTNTRWLQRFENFEKAFLKLNEAMLLRNPNELERNGTIQRFEFTIELSWKVLKDFLESKGFLFKPSPKGSFRLAQQHGYIDYAQTLIDGLAIRNDLSHDYSGEKFEQYESILKTEIFPAIEKLYLFFNEQKKNN